MIAKTPMIAIRVRTSAAIAPETIKAIYKEYTKVPMRKLNEILKHDLWFDADTCQELGLVDFIQ